MKQNETKKSQKIPEIFRCELCDYISSNRKDFLKHSSTQKHKNRENETNETKKSQKIPTGVDSSFQCFCGIDFKSRTTLWRHRKKGCNGEIANLKKDLANEEKQKQLVEYLLKENSEFKQLMIEQNKHMIELAKNAGHNNSHNTTSNIINNNQSFNLQFFLNETCKDAMNIMDFVSQLNVGINDLEETGRLGFAEGISKIFINGLKQININDRPIHCSDSKRETLYIRNNNQWAKEGEDKLLLTNAIKHVAHKNMKQIFEWTKEHPGCDDPDSKYNDSYLQIVSESMCGSTKEETNKNYNKIIKNIAKETVIDK
jgi:hypothetical protein